MKYKQLNQRHPDYDATALQRNELLYQGGQAIVSNARLFMPQEPGENANTYQRRLGCANYTNYFAEIVNGYVSDLFSKPLTVCAAEAQEAGDVEANLPPFYLEFSEDADLQDSSLQEVLRRLTAEAMTHDRAYLGCDFPSVDQAPETLLEEEQSGVDRAYVYSVPNASVIDWERDEWGRYLWVILRSEEARRESIDGDRSVRTIRFKHWFKTPTGAVKWAVYEFKCKANREPQPNEEAALVAEGDVSFKDIPIACLELPEELRVGQLIASPVANVFKRRTQLDFAQGRSLTEILVFKQGPDIPPPGAGISSIDNPQRGNSARQQALNAGALVCAAEDEVEFVGPSGIAFDYVHQQMKDQVDDIHRVTHSMAQAVSNTESSLGRSGKSKQQDNKAKEIVLSAYADIIKNFTRRLYNLISAARSERIEWVCLGMDSYKQVDRTELLAEATAISTINIPSPTWKKKQLKRLISDLEDDLSPAEQLLIFGEIDEAVDAAPDMSLVTPEQEAANAKDLAEHGTEQTIAVEKVKAKARPKPAPKKKAKK